MQMRVIFKASCWAGAVLALAAIAYGQTAIVTLMPLAASGSVAPGSNITIPLQINSTSPTAAVEFSYAVPPEISSIAISAGTSATAAGKTLQCRGTSTVVCLVDGLNQNGIPAGTLANLVATISTVTQASGTTINFSNPIAVDPAGSGQATAPIPGASIQVQSGGAISALTCNSYSLTSGGSTACAVWRNGTAVALPVTINSSNGALSISPSSMTIPVGATHGSFTATAGTITTGGSAIVTASAGPSNSATTISLTPPSLANKCDLNGDGKVDVSDVAAAENQMLGKTACTTADLNGDGKCLVNDLQSVITAALGGACRTVF
jgi:hypothetical protein